jgi:hypothetical protein
LVGTGSSVGFTVKNLLENPATTVASVDVKLSDTYLFTIHVLPTHTSPNITTLKGIAV